MTSHIEITGAKEHNLKNIDIKIPRNKIVCFVGVSGSGKSTLVFDIIAKEGKRQYFQSLSSFARRYLDKNNRPDIDSIIGLSSTIVIDQKQIRGNVRSTVGTLSEAYTYLRLLFARCAKPIHDSSAYSFNHPNGACPNCKGIGERIDFDPHSVVDFGKCLNKGALRPGDYKVGGRMWNIFKATNFFDMDKKIKNYSKENLEKLLYSKPVRLSEEISGFVQSWTFEGIISRMRRRNNKKRKTKKDSKYLKAVPCKVCNGLRLKEKSLKAKINSKNIGEVANLSINESIHFLKEFEHKHAQVIKPKLINILTALKEVGLGYLSLHRSTDTLSGGEAQRLKLARQLGCDLSETIYVLDEPTSGLHEKDAEKILKIISDIKDKENTILLIEHHKAIIEKSDYIVELGPSGGREGGQIIFENDANKISSTNCKTGKYLVSDSINLKKTTRKPNNYISIKNANLHNLNDLSLNLPKENFITLTGVSGSGKSSLCKVISKKHKSCIFIDQSGVGRSKRSCVATYTNIFNKIRKLFAEKNNVGIGLFSFNSDGGCTECGGIGHIDMDMNFLGSIKIKCCDCKGNRYKKKLDKYKFNNKRIYEILDMTVKEAISFFKNHKSIHNKLNLLEEVGLDYIKLGQSLDTLSGGEAQRIKLTSQLTQDAKTIILDEPTANLHFEDVEKLLKLLNELVNNKHTLIVVEHNLKVISQSDWIVDLGPEGGEKGGNIIFEGTPSQLIRSKVPSYTADALKNSIAC